MSNVLQQVYDGYDSMHDRLMWNIGIMAGILITGGLISFGTSCIFLLSGTRNPKTSLQNLLFRMHILVLLFLVVGFMIVEVLWCNGFVIFYLRMAPERANQSYVLLVFFANTIPVFLAVLTDGLLTWRCYQIQKLLVKGHSPKRWQNIFWIFPACLWGLIIGTGFTSASLILAEARDQIPPTRKTGALEATAILLNVALNVYATLFITVRLYNYRLRGMVTADISCYLHHIVAILLESAAINVPLTIATAIGIGLGAHFGSIIAPVSLAGQAFASVIVIHRVAVRRQEEEQTQAVRVYDGAQEKLVSTRRTSDGSVCGVKRESHVAM